MPKMTAEEYQGHSRKTALLNLERRRNAWKDEGCKSIYRDLIKAAGGPSIVRPGMRGRAKDLAINCYLSGKTGPVEAFVADVNAANVKQFKANVKQSLADESAIIMGTMRNEGIEEILHPKRKVNF